VTDVRGDTGAGSGALVFLKPVFHTKVWGGARLAEEFGYELPSDTVGECLAISARPEGDCPVVGGPLAGKTLSQLWSERRDLFGGLEGDTFPLQVKLLDAREDLSVQVHPDEESAARLGGRGKSEGWYVIRPSASGSVLIGHAARTREEFALLATKGRWDELLRRVPMAAGDFFFVPAGTVHAIPEGSLIYEVQQSSDTTYRLYDYGRLDGGRPRELHVESALQVVTAPSLLSATPPEVTGDVAATQSVYARNDCFSLAKWEVRTAAAIPVEAPFLLVSALEGSGTVNGETVRAGDHFLVPSGVPVLDVSGPLTIVVASV
jgi:mannose-6-phosphate isomerase